MRPNTQLLKFLAGLTVVLACGSPNSFAQKKQPGVPATADDYRQLTDAKYLMGTLIAFDDSSDKLVVRVDVPHLEPNPSYRPPNYQAQAKSQAIAQARQIQQQQQRQFQHQQTLNRLQRQVAQARTPQQRQQAMVQLARELARMQVQQAQAAARQQAQNVRNASKAIKNASSAAKNSNNQPYKVVTVAKVYELDVAQDTVVRKLFLATEFDDTGNYKVYTERDKAALRGTDATKPGYRANVSELFPAQEMKLYLAPAKRTKREVRPDDDLDGPVNRPVVTMIVMTRENTSR